METMDFVLICGALLSFVFLTILLIELWNHEVEKTDFSEGIYLDNHNDKFLGILEDAKQKGDEKMRLIAPNYGGIN